MNLPHRAIVALATILAFPMPAMAGTPGAPVRQADVESSPADVLVVGGTPAGVAAAIAAARGGARVILASAAPDLGGVLSDAEMDQWDLNLAPDGAPVQHDAIFTEMYDRLGDVFTPQAAAGTFAAMVAAEPRISVRYDEVPAGVVETGQAGGERVEAVDFRSAANGRVSRVTARYVVDASDGGDLAVLAGARYDVGRQDSGIDEGMQAVTEMFEIAGVDWARLADAYDARRDGPGGVLGPRAWGYDKLMRAYEPGFPNVVVRDLNLGRLPDGDVTVNAIDVCGIDGRDAAQLALARRETEREAARLVEYLRVRAPGFAHATVERFAPAVYVRETRHIAGLERLTTADVWDGVVPDDSIGLASYPIDLHPVEPSDEPAYAPVRHVYGIPFGALVPRGLANVLLASPAISASHLASGSARVVPTTVEEGEADGSEFAALLRQKNGAALSVADYLATREKRIAARRQYPTRAPV